MVEVFKTNVISEFQALKLVGVIEHRFEGYKVNFDLEDRDRILRIVSQHRVEVDPLVNFLKDLGVRAEVLPDEIDNIPSLFASCLMIR